MSEQLSVVEINQRIHVIRGQKVMLDEDLAELYETEVKVINRVALRNIQRFPDDFRFQLTPEEHESLKSLRYQIGTLDVGKGKYRKYLPFAFTEQGVAMLSGVLNTGRAIQVNIAIMRTFVKMRQLGERPGIDPVRFEKLESDVKQLKEARQILKPSEPQKSLKATVEVIQKSVAKYYGLKLMDLKSTTRTQAIAFPRQVAIYLIRKHTDASLVEVGKHLGGKDHSTVLHACKKVEEAIQSDLDIRAAVEAISAEAGLR